MVESRPHISGNASQPHNASQPQSPGDSGRLSAAASGATLIPLTSIRFFAAMQLFAFHVHAISRMRAGGGVFEPFPKWFVTAIQQGWFATPLFFLISGFILAYLYVSPVGELTTSRKQFWIARLTRIYPLHVFLLLVGCLVAIGFVIAQPSQAAANGVLIFGGMAANFLLVQAWIPPLALSGNFPTWALSTVVFFYAVFPWVVRVSTTWKPHHWTIALVALPFISVAPTLVFYSLGGHARFPDMSWQSELIMRFPPFWLPHFLLGVALARRFEISRYTDHWRATSSSALPSWGDLAATAALALLCNDLAPIRFLLRHGALAPLYLIVVYDLALGRGWLSRMLSPRWLKTLGETSFSIFMLQLPVIAAGMGLLWAIDLPSRGLALLQLPLLLSLGLLASLASTYLFEKPVSRRLRARFAADKQPDVDASGESTAQSDRDIQTQH
ncbi:MAG: acyltransferase [Pirellulaceae bacterium]|nr:acyltransferase [Pirellulaceae bacterium]MDP7018028.1 acyltransferase [Pirellulaceae bacterium]